LSWWLIGVWVIFYLLHIFFLISVNVKNTHLRCLYNNTLSVWVSRSLLDSPKVFFFIVIFRNVVVSFLLCLVSNHEITTKPNSFLDDATSLYASCDNFLLDSGGTCEQCRQKYKLSPEKITLPGICRRKQVDEMLLMSNMSTHLVVIHETGVCR